MPARTLSNCRRDQGGTKIRLWKSRTKRQKYEKIKDKRKIFVLIGMITLNRPWHPIFIGWGGIVLVGLIKSIFESLNRIRSVWIILTGRLNRSDRCVLVQKSENF
jgi:hypothetical protein